MHAATKIVHYRYKNKECYGILNGQTVLCLPALARYFGKQLPQRLEDFIFSGETAIEAAEDLFKKANGSEIRSVSASLSAVSILAPIAFPHKIICLGLNYVDHAAETKAAVPDEPIFFHETPYYHNLTKRERCQAKLC